MLETGPLRVNADGTLRVVQGTAWNEYANVLYLDQPAGTGFSFVNKNDNVRELDAAAGQVIVFLRHFYDIFPEYSTMDVRISALSRPGRALMNARFADVHNG
jgi:carboxypeptidase D